MRGLQYVAFLLVLFAPLLPTFLKLQEVALAKQEATKPVLLPRPTPVALARCLVDGQRDERITWIVRNGDGSVKAAGFVIIRRCAP